MIRSMKKRKRTDGRASTHLDDDLACGFNLVNQRLLVRCRLALLTPQGAKDAVGLNGLRQSGVNQRHAAHRVLAEEHVLLEEVTHLTWKQTNVTYGTRVLVPLKEPVIGWETQRHFPLTKWRDCYHDFFTAYRVKNGVSAWQKI